MGSIGICNNAMALIIPGNPIIGGEWEIETGGCTESTYKSACADDLTGSSWSYHGCSVDSCNTCRAPNPSDPNSYGIITYDNNYYNVDCDSRTQTATCTCQKAKAYRCASGYYGTATSASAGCTKCPDNATCAGGNSSTFKCNQGYYKNGSACTRCPASGSVYGTTKGKPITGSLLYTEEYNATDITECYLPSGTPFISNTSGSGIYTNDCYYTK